MKQGDGHLPMSPSLGSVSASSTLLSDFSCCLHCWRRQHTRETISGYFCRKTCQAAISDLFLPASGWPQGGSTKPANPLGPLLRENLTAQESASNLQGGSIFTLPHPGMTDRNSEPDQSFPLCVTHPLIRSLSRREIASDQSPSFKAFDFGTERSKLLNLSLYYSVVPTFC